MMLVLVSFEFMFAGFEIMLDGILQGSSVTFEH